MLPQLILLLPLVQGLPCPSCTKHLQQPKFQPGSLFPARFHAGGDQQDPDPSQNTRPCQGRVTDGFPSPAPRSPPRRQEMELLAWPGPAGSAEPQVLGASSSRGRGGAAWMSQSSSVSWPERLRLPHPGAVQGQGLEQPGPVEDVPARARGGSGCCFRPVPNQTIPWFHDPGGPRPWRPTVPCPTAEHVPSVGWKSWSHPWSRGQYSPWTHLWEHQDVPVPTEGGNAFPENPGSGDEM